MLQYDEIPHEICTFRVCGIVVSLWFCLHSVSTNFVQNEWAQSQYLSLQKKFDIKKKEISKLKKTFIYVRKYFAKYLPQINYLQEVRASEFWLKNQMCNSYIILVKVIIIVIRYYNHKLKSIFLKFRLASHRTTPPSHLLNILATR